MYIFNQFSFEPKIKFELIGILLGLANFNSIILDIKFPQLIYKKLLDIKITLEDLKEIDEDTYNSFKFILNSDDPDLEQNLDQNFTTIVSKFGEQKLILLKVRRDKIIYLTFRQMEILLWSINQINMSM